MPPATRTANFERRFLVRRPTAKIFSGIVLLITMLVSVPIVIVVGSLLVPDTSGTWSHLLETVFDDYVVNSILLVIGVGILTLLIGVPTAWFTAMCEFPGRRFFIWMLLLPLAFPAYIIAYTYTGILDFPGPVQTWIRDVTGWKYGEYWFFEIRSLSGAIVMLSLVLYPYVYLITRAAFLEQSVRALEISRTLGCSFGQSFYRVGVPMARPAIVTGVSLALMETLADYGTVQYFGVSTFTTGIFRTFYGLGETAVAVQLSAVLLFFVALLIFLERYSRRRARYYLTEGRSSHEKRLQLQGNHVLLAWFVCLTPVLLGFLIPALILLKWSVFDAVWSGTTFFKLIFNSFYLALSAAVIAVVLALLLGYTKRNHNTRLVRFSIGVSGLGYAVPGTVIALGVIVMFGWTDRNLGDIVENLSGKQLGLFFSGTLFALLFAYTVRFLAISLNTVQSGLGSIKPNLDDAARSLGYKTPEVLRLIHVPLIFSSVLTALLIVFVDVLKELPATLMLRPFNFNTLAVRAYELASDERLADAALPSLMIVVVGLLPVIYLSRIISKGPRNGN